MKTPTQEFRVVRRNGKYYAERKFIVRPWFGLGQKREAWRACLYDLWLEQEASYDAEDAAWKGVDRLYGGEKLKPDAVISQRHYEHSAAQHSKSKEQT